MIAAGAVLVFTLAAAGVVVAAVIVGARCEGSDDGG